MTGNCFADTETSAVPLEGGHTLTVKNDLTYEESLQLAAASYGKDGAFDLVRFRLRQIELRVVDWDLTDAAGTPVEYSPAAVTALKPAVGTRISEAIAAFEREREGNGAGEDAAAPASTSSANSTPASATASKRT